MNKFQKMKTEQMRKKLQLDKVYKENRTYEYLFKTLKNLLQIIVTKK